MDKSTPEQSPSKDQNQARSGNYARARLERYGKQDFNETVPTCGAMNSALIVFDLEFTAWEDSLSGHWLAPGEFKEVVQIGAVRLDLECHAVTASFDCLVQPVINPTLSDYFQSLTGITNARLAHDSADFAAAYRRFATFAEGSVIAAFGHDEWVLEDNIRLLGLKDMPALPPFLELRSWFRQNGVDPEGLHSCDIGPKLGVPFEGQMHNALCDARSVAAGMIVLLKRGASLSL